MAKVLQHRRGTTAEHSNFTGAAGEITFDTTAKRLVAHDGSTKGGIPVATKQEVEQVANSLDPRILDAASQADILEAVGQVTGGTVSQPTLEGLQSQISANASNIASVANKPTPVRYVTETWSSGASWYTKYNDGWIEQGGLGASGTGSKVVTLFVAYKTVNYSLTQVPISFETNAYGAYANALSAQTTSSFTLSVGSNYLNGFYWRTEGY